MQPQGNCIQKLGGSVATNRTGLNLKTKNKQTKKTSKSAYKALASIPNGFIGKADKQSTAMWSQL